MKFELEKLYFLVYSIVTLVVVIGIMTLLGAKISAKTNEILDFDQFDSLCTVDNIPRNLGEWMSSDYYNDKTEKLETTFIFIKGDTLIYEVKELDEGMFNVTKTHQ